MDYEESDVEFLKRCGKIFDDYMAQLNDSDYIINPPQWLKLVNVTKFFSELTKKTGGYVEPCEIEPKYQHGGLTAYFQICDIAKEDIPKFCAALSQADAITIDATTDYKVCISMSINNVFKHK